MPRLKYSTKFRTLVSYDCAISHTLLTPRNMRNTMKKFTNRGRLPLFVSVATAGLLALSACGGSSDDAADGELTPVEVGVIPIGDVASIYVGQQEGIFEEHGIDLTLTQAQGGAAIVPGVQSGDLDFGYSNVTSLVMARSQGLPIQIVATGPQTTGSADEDFAAVMVAPDSGIESVTDLEGKTLAVNTLNNIFDSVISSGLEQEGGDPEQVEFVEMARSEEHTSALQSRFAIVCRLLLEKKNPKIKKINAP